MLRLNRGFVMLTVLALAALACQMLGPAAQPTATRVPPRNTPTPRATAEPTEAEPTQEEPTEEVPTEEVPAGDEFTDDFADTGSGWPDDQANGATFGYADEAYQVSVQDEDGYAVPTPGLDYEDVGVEADVTWVDGTVETGQMGVACRVLDDQNLYRFFYGPDDTFGIGRLLDGDWLLLGRRQRQPSSVDPEAGATNRVRADCVGDTLTLSINDEPLLQVHDDALTSGDVGLWAYSPDGGLEVSFDDFAAAPSDFADAIADESATEPGEVLVETSFDDEDVFSPEGDVEGGTMVVEDSAYHITVQNEYWDLWHYLDEDYEDSIAAVDATWVSDPETTWDAWAGVVCRVTDFDNHYAFLLSPDGYAAIRLREGGEDYYLADGMTPYLADLDTTFRVRGDCVGDTLSLYVDDELVFRVTDSTFTAGPTGLLVGSGQNVPAEATLDNFAVYEP